MAASCFPALVSNICEVFEPLLALATLDGVKSVKVTKASRGPNQRHYFSSNVGCNLVRFRLQNFANVNAAYFLGLLPCRLIN